MLALVEGPTLADRIDAGALVQDEALSVAKQIIAALEYARIRDHRPRLGRHARRPAFLINTRIAALVMVGLNWQAGLRK